jgi:hypothetical protein
MIKIFMERDRRPAPACGAGAGRRAVCRARLHLILGILPEHFFGSFCRIALVNHFFGSFCRIILANYYFGSLCWIVLREGAEEALR